MRASGPKAWATPPVVAKVTVSGVWRDAPVRTVMGVCPVVQANPTAVRRRWRTRSVSNWTRTALLTMSRLDERVLSCVVIMWQKQATW